ncbi:MAG: DUF6208 family protein [Jaaginema sp. PMC 1079.18]|nr:DUF6208 family protein [Jaaginema sp. PMC 1080.18]MEC4849618.1 DUF6208 family protein [Jaaginema sp. PMC 1079.18]MEC4866208.1 DUF6208 family protein [Jaaginema sp. PMC 1078.18]
MTQFWQIPLAILSLGFYKISKLIISQIYAIYLAISSRKSPRWRVLSEQTLKNPLGLPVIMTKGPRWNTHAIVASLAPIKVQSSLSVAVKIAEAAAESWTVVVYRYPDYKTIANLGSLSSKAREDWATVKLQPGKYAVVLRYYEWGETVQLPTLKTDDREFLAAQPLDPNINAFLADLSQIKNVFYRGLHYYIFVLLKWRDRLPESWVKQEFLPVGDRDNYFGYGYCETGEILSFEFSPELQKHYKIYLTLYNRSSFPTFWTTLSTATYQTQPISQDGFYLLRFRAQSPQATETIIPDDSHWKISKIR